MGAVPRLGEGARAIYSRRRRRRPRGDLYLLDDAGTLQVDGDDVPLRRGDAVLVPVDVDQGIIARGDVPLRVAIVFTLVG